MEVATKDGFCSTVNSQSHSKQRVWVFWDNKDSNKLLLIWYGTNNTSENTDLIEAASSCHQRSTLPCLHCMFHCKHYSLTTCQGVLRQERTKAEHSFKKIQPMPWLTQLLFFQLASRLTPDLQFSQAASKQDKISMFYTFFFFFCQGN